MKLDYRSCDRCGKEYKNQVDKEHPDIYTVSKRVTPDGQYPIMSDKCDLCTSCYFDFMDFMKGKATDSIIVRIHGESLDGGTVEIRSDV